MRSFTTPPEKEGAQPKPVDKILAAAITPGGAVLVSDDDRDAVLRFDDAGSYQGTFPGGRDAAKRKVTRIVLDSEGGSLGVASVLKGAGLTGSTSEAFRMIQQGAVRIDGERVADRDMSIESGCTHVFQVGKRRFARITLR